jgi:hypothetical protein
MGHVFQTLDEAETVPNDEYTVQHFLRPGSEGDRRPQAFFVDAVPGHEVGAHFHPVDQFQLMYGGQGEHYQRHPIPRAFLHYTDAYTVYGPFGASPNAHFNFFTLRGERSALHGSMPANRDQYLYRGARRLEIDLEPFLDQPPAPAGEVEVNALIDPQEDGLAAFLLCFGRDAVSAPPLGELRTGRYTVVLEGEVRWDGKELQPRSLGWTTGEVPDPVLEGGSNGAKVLFLHLPFPDTPAVHGVSS